MGTPAAGAPARLGRYELLARLATGGMGEIFLARLEGAAGFEKLFVVKRILPHLADDARFRQMLIAEARVASKMAHGNICQVYELGETDGQLYIVMEYLEGVSLLPFLRRASKSGTPLALGLVGAIVQQTADALHYAHELRDRTGEYLGIVHRDVTPSNIFVTESGIAKVLDFGIAKVKDAQQNTQTGTVKGKYAYMAPEQLKGGGLDRRADVFALGIVVFEMLALRRLFQRKTDYLTFRAVMEEPIADVRRYRHDVPEAVAAVLTRTLDRDPAARFATARQFGTAMLDALAPVQRPWSQGEVGDYLRETFADVLGKRHSQVATAVHRGSPSAAPGQVGRATMPLVAYDDGGEGPPDDDDDEFPEVDSTIGEAPAYQRPGLPQPVTGAGSDFKEQTPPPFGAETHASGSSIQPLVHAPSGPVIAPATLIAPARRSLVWPLLAVAMVGVAIAALVLVYKQMQSQQQQQQNPIIIQQGPAERDAAPVPGPAGSDDTAMIDHGSGAASGSASDSGSGSTSGPNSGSGAGSGRTRPHVPTNTVKPASPYTVAVRVHSAEINQCGHEYGVPPKGSRAKITIAPTGKPKAVSFDPSSLDPTPLGTCLKNVLKTVAFPSAPAEVSIDVFLQVS